MASISPLPQRLLEARTLKGISQKKLGIQLGMEPGSASGRMNHYEKGRHTPDYPTLKRIAAELDVPVAYFFCESRIIAELVCRIEKLSEKEQKALLGQIKCIKEDPSA
ncbi:MAG: helix-turn-helix transcriptional regulator [Zhongshania sp.]|uniref:helix-turn-helix domain-containing protein n=1 Tax=Spongiibacter sp. IMCC21906 TaxID=1620392 RepID=UPI00062E0220|nr:helix-turn-helix transcriptional regulator [Spongiibacter sp. IMCC21906]AKH68806.1 Helix-turn-helix domain [Spongiibacter sp. IMCC21906]MBQ0758386.1 helix-turn-helix transcriptional regulator [Zhongshania sp.]